MGLTVPPGASGVDLIKIGFFFQAPGGNWIYSFEAPGGNCATVPSIFETPGGNHRSRRGALVHGPAGDRRKRRAGRFRADRQWSDEVGGTGRGAAGCSLSTHPTA